MMLHVPIGTVVCFSGGAVPAGWEIIDSSDFLPIPDGWFYAMKIQEAAA